MLVRTATSGRKRSSVSAWNEETSQTKSRAAFSERNPDSGEPMFPASATGRPARRRTSAIQLVVVDLPLVPVTATQRLLPGGSTSASAIRHATSSSARTGIPAARAAWTGGAVSGTPGEIASHSALSRNPTIGTGPPKKSRAPRSRKDSTEASAPANAASVRLSPIATETPRASSASASARPLRANPSTATRRGRTPAEGAFAKEAAALIAASGSRARGPRTGSRGSRSG